MVVTEVQAEVEVMVETAVPAAFVPAIIVFATMKGVMAEMAARGETVVVVAADAAAMRMGFIQIMSADHPTTP